MIAGSFGRAGIDDAEQDDPAVGHQHGIHEDEQDCDANRPPVGGRQRIEHRARLAVPENVGCQPARDGQAEKSGRASRPGPSHGRYTNAAEESQAAS